ncbi:hypothetical protein ACHAW5_002682 [Stephanodiscus triporus]|uniref:Methyltransferase type 11 domain-containing protein n=1 Tax=Stephanodiscus triporus TaxID=2934178 RepID=A0ABD3N9N6_9STRA
MAMQTLLRRKGFSSVAAKPALIWKTCLIIASLFLFRAYMGAPFFTSLSNGAVPAFFDRPMVGSWGPYGSFVPEGPAVALPSVQITPEEDSKIERHIYGGKGDKAHLGGFTAFDEAGVSVSVWKHMVNHLGIKSVLDLGCGKGISTSWFVIHGLKYVVCAEGSHDAVTHSLLPKIKHIPDGTQSEIVEHDFSRGPWWPSRTVDVVWCVEFTEHVGRNYQPNYLSAWRKAALIFMTHSYWGGWHHVEVHADPWWITRMTAMGFVYSDLLTQEIRGKQGEDSTLIITNPRNESDQKSFNTGQHVMSMLVFINPHVASRPEHAHLFAEHGCFNGDLNNLVECGKEGTDGTPLPDSFKPLKMTKEMDDQWIELLQDHVIYPKG